MGKKASSAPAAATPESGPKVTMLDASATAKANVRKKRAPMQSVGPSIIGADTLGGGGVF